MKRLTLLFLLPFLCFVPLTPVRAESEAPAVQMESKTYPLNGFDALDVSWTFQVELTQSPDYSVVVEAPDFILPYLDVRVRKSCLKLGVSDASRDIRKRLEKGNYRIVARVSMPALSGLDMSGATKLEANGSFRSAKDEFGLELSGAAEVKSLTVSARRGEIDCSGASKFVLDGDFESLEIDLSGAANGKMKSSGNNADIDLSGSSKLFLEGRYQYVKAEAGGAASAEMKGTADRLVFEGSGAAKGQFLECPARQARVDLSGASRLRLEVEEDLSVRLSGAASCQYRAGDRFTLSSTDVSRGATLKRL